MSIDLSGAGVLKGGASLLQKQSTTLKGSGKLHKGPAPIGQHGTLHKGPAPIGQHGNLHKGPAPIPQSFSRPGAGKAASKPSFKFNNRKYVKV